MVELEIKPKASANTRVVAVILSAMAISATLVYLLTGGGRVLFAAHSTIFTYVPDAAGLKLPAEVRLSGIPVGTVNKIELSGLLDPQRAVRVEMSVDTGYLRSIPSDSETSVSADNLVGWEFVSIDEGKSPIPAHPDGTLRGKPLNQSVDSANLLKSLQDELSYVDNLLNEISSPDTTIGKFVLGQQDYDELLARVGSFAKSLQAIQSPDNKIGQALFSDALYRNIYKYVADIETAMAAIQRGEGAAGRLFASDAQYAEFVGELREFRAALADANAGKGRLGPWLRDDADYRRIRKLLSDTDAMIASLTAGEGRTGDLLVSAQLYESLTGSLKSMRNLIADLREHPQKYLRYKVF